jgi:hypothetical protein
LLPAVFVMAAVMVFAPLASASAVPTFNQIEVTEDQKQRILGTQALDLLEKLQVQIVDIEYQQDLVFVALDNEQVLVIEDERIVAAIGAEEQLKLIIEDDVRVIPAELIEIQALETVDEAVMIVQEKQVSVINTEKILTEIPVVTEIAVADESVFWKTEQLIIEDAVITSENEVIILAQDRVHFFEDVQIDTQVPQIIEVPTTIVDLKTVIANPIALTEKEGIVAIFNESEIVLTETTELIKEDLTSQLIIETLTEAPIEVELVTVENIRDVTLAVVERENVVETYRVDMIANEVLVQDIVEITPSMIEDVKVELSSPIVAIEVDERANLLIIHEDNTIVQIDELAVQLLPRTNEVTSMVTIVQRSDIPVQSTCSVAITEGTTNYGELTIGQTATTSLKLAVEGTPVISIMGTEWINQATEEVILPVDVTHYALQEDLAYTEMLQLTEIPVSLEQIPQDEVPEVTLALQIPETFDRESLDATQSVMFFAEC